MILPIVAYGDPILKREAEEIDEQYPDLKQLIENMFETMYNAHGVGLAAPQIGLGIRLFIVDASSFAEDTEDIQNEEEKAQLEKLKGFKRVFINPVMIEEDGKPWNFSEGCLSIPDIREDVSRKADIVLEYFDEDFNLREEAFDGMAARIIQHEYDHIEGILFTDHLSPLRRQFLRKRLNDISKGAIKVDYKMKFPKR